MSQQYINIGATPNDGLGDPIRTAFQKTNENFSELYANSGNGGGNANTGNVTFDNINIIGTGNLHLQPDPANTGSYLDIFLTSGPDLHLVASASANLILGKDNTSNVRTSWDGNVTVQSWNLNTGNSGGTWTFGSDGNLAIPGNINIAGQIVGNYTPSSTTGTAILTQGANTLGGTGYFDFMKIVNQSSNVTNPNKTLRIDSTGNLQVVNSAYSQTILNLTDAGELSAGGNVYGANFATTGSGGNITGANVISATTFTASGNIITSGNISAVGNVTANNILTAGIISTVGNISTNGYFVGNFSGNISGNLVVPGSNTQVIYNNNGSANASAALTFDFSSNALVVTGNITANSFTGNGSRLSSLAGANVTGTVANATYATTSGSANTANTAGSANTATTAATVTTNAQPNITSVGTLTSLTVTGNINSGNLRTTGLISATGNITGNYLIGNGSTLSNITAGNIVGQVANALISSTVYTNAQPNITSVGTLTSLSVTGNVTASNFIGNLSNGNSKISIASSGNISFGIGPFDTTVLNVNSSTGISVLGNIVASQSLYAVGNVYSTGNVYSNGNIAMVSNIPRNTYVANVAPTSGDGNVGDIWYQY